MPIIPSGGAYPGIINEATLLADAAAAVAAAKAAAVPDAATVAAAKAAAVPDAATVAALVSPAQGHAATVAALVSPAQADAATVAALVSPSQADAATVAALVSPAQADASTVAALVSPAQGNAATVAALVSPAQADAAATAAAKNAANAAYDAIIGVPLRVDAAQSLNETQRAQGRENLGVGTSGGCAYASGTHTPATAYPTLNDFEAHAEVVHGITGTLFSVVHGGGTYAVAANDARYGSARWRGVSYAASTGVLTLLADGVAHATETVLTAGPVTVSPLSGVTGTVIRAPRIYNRALTESERLQVIRGETPASLANRADGVSYTQGESQTFTNTAGAWLAYGEGLGASVAATGGKLVCTGASEVGWCNQFYNGGVPFPAGEYAATFKARSVSGTVAGLRLTTPYDGTSSAGNTAVAITGTEATYTVSVTLTKPAVVGINPVAGSSAGCVYELDDVVIVRLGTVARYEPQNVTSLGRWLDSSGNCYDLIPGAGITPLNPSPSLSRVIAATVSGATVTAGTVASIGTLTGATPADTAALAAVRQWDAVSATWGQARPANAAALVPTATANGAVTLETSAHTSNATVSAGTAVKLAHHPA